MNIKNTCMTILLMLAGTTACWAQAIDIMPRAYQETPPLPIALPPSAAAMTAGPGSVRAWDATVEDGTLQKVIARWAELEGWVFTPGHWTVERDLPVVGRNTFQGDFKSAVRGLLLSSELTDLPVQPCFYSNRVIRVVHRAEVCDRMANQ